MHVRFIVLNLGTPDRFRKGDSLSPSCCHLILRPLDFLNRRMFVQRIRQNVLVSCRNLGGISLMRSRNIAVFLQHVTRGYVMWTLARGFRQNEFAVVPAILSKIIWTHPEF